LDALGYRLSFCIYVDLSACSYPYLHNRPVRMMQRSSDCRPVSKLLLVHDVT